MSGYRIEEWFLQVGLNLQALEDHSGLNRGIQSGPNAWQPRIDLFEDEGRFVIRAEVAGVAADSVQVLYVASRHSVVLRGRRSDTLGQNATSWHTLEIPDGEFLREVELPASTVAAANMRAQLRNGFLVVMVPKA